MKTYYIVYHDAWGQHGTDIIPIKLTKKEYQQRKENDCLKYFITDNYASALYWTQD